MGGVVREVRWAARGRYVTVLRAERILRSCVLQRNKAQLDFFFPPRRRAGDPPHVSYLAAIPLGRAGSPRCYHNRNNYVFTLSPEPARQLHWEGDWEIIRVWR